MVGSMKRRCEKCQAILSSYNDKDICGACEPPDYDTNASTVIVKRARVCKKCNSRHASSESTLCTGCRRNEMGGRKWL